MTWDQQSGASVRFPATATIQRCNAEWLIRVELGGSIAV